MRRIIERIVTVVTTTTWKISWEADPPASMPAVDPVFEDLPLPEATPPDPTVFEPKEVDLPEEKANAHDQA